MNKPSSLKWMVLVALSVLSLSACKIKQMVAPKMPEFAKVDSIQLPDAASFFNDKRLQALLDQAVRHNPDFLALEAGVQSQRAELLAGKTHFCQI